MPAPLNTNTLALFRLTMSMGDGSQSWGSVPEGTMVVTFTRSPPIFAAKSAIG